MSPVEGYTRKSLEAPLENNGDIVDCDVLEAAKENIQPIATGRRVTTLQAVLATPHGKRDARLTAMRAQLRDEVDAALADAEESGCGDPLEAYCRFVNWTIEHYPQGHSAESGILELLEEATRRLKDDEEARDDPRYLKLWILYASYVERPAVIYAFLLANDIGTSLAHFYEEYALVLERSGQKTEADEMYNLGIARKATPLVHLKKRYAEFQKRMMANVAPGPPEPVILEASTQQNTAPNRRVLGERAAPAPASSSRSAGGASRRRAAAPSSTIPIHADDVFSAPTSASRTTAASASKPKANARMQIFVDSEADAGERGESSAWPELGTRKARVKENVPEVSKAAGTTLKKTGKRAAAGGSAGGARKPSAQIVPFVDDEGEGNPEPPAKKAPPLKKLGEVPPKTPAKVVFQPFCDDEEKNEGAPMPSTPKFVPFRDDEDTDSGEDLLAPDAVMKPKVSVATSEAEALRKDPLKNYKD